MNKILLVPALLAVFLVSCGEETSSYDSNPLGPGDGSTTTTHNYNNSQNNTNDVRGDTVVYRERGVGRN